MFHKALFTLFMLGGIVLISSCNPQAQQPEASGNHAQPGFRALRAERWQAGA